MSLDTQIRRGLFGIAALIGMITLASAQNPNALTATALRDEMMACTTLDATRDTAETSDDVGGSESHQDWRGLLPAVIFRTRN
jgi:hypothetical protein